MAIEYRTEAKLLIEDTATNPMVVQRLKGDVKLRLHKDGVNIILTPAQLLKLCENAPTICADLQP